MARMKPNLDGIRQLAEELAPELEASEPDRLTWEVVQWKRRPCLAATGETQEYRIKPQGIPKRAFTLWFLRNGREDKFSEKFTSEALAKQHAENCEATQRSWQQHNLTQSIEAITMAKKKGNGQKATTAPATGPDPATMSKAALVKSIPGYEGMANKEVIQAVRQTYNREVTSADVAAAKQKRKGKASPGKRTRQTAPASNNGRPSLQTEVRQDAANDFLASLDALKQLRDRIGGDGIRKALELMGDQ